MQLELAFLERPAAPAARMKGPWDQIDPQAQIAALDILSRLIAQMLAASFGALTDLDVPLPRSRPATVRTDEETLDLVRRLAALYPDTVIAGILNRQGRTTARGHRFEANRVASLRTHWRIPCSSPSRRSPKERS